MIMLKERLEIVLTGISGFDPSVEYFFEFRNSVTLRRKTEEDLRRESLDEVFIPSLFYHADEGLNEILLPKIEVGKTCVIGRLEPIFGQKKNFAKFYPQIYDSKNPGMAGIISGEEPRTLYHEKEFYLGRGRGILLKDYIIHVDKR